LIRLWKLVIWIVNYRGFLQPDLSGNPFFWMEMFWQKKDWERKAE